MQFEKFSQFLVVMSVVFFSFQAQAADCLGQWQVLPSHYAGRGTPCQSLGLDSHRGVCQPGNVYETLCDDTSKNRYKTCQGLRVCNSDGYPQPPVPQFDCTTWDFEANRPCPAGYVNSDCKSGCQSLVPQQNNCTSWDYQYNQPCPPGFINRDCQGSCEPIQ